MLISKIVKKLFYIVRPLLHFLGLTHHRIFSKRIDRSDIYKHALANGFIISSTKNSKPALHFVRKEFRRLGGSVDSLPDDWWAMFIKIGTKNEPYSEKFIDQLVERTSALDTTILDMDDWLDLYAASSRFGLFRVGSILREKSMERALKDNRKSRKYQQLKLGAAIENGDWEYADDILKEYSPFNERSKSHYLAVWLISTYKNTKTSFPLSKLIKQDLISLPYLEYIQNRSIAVVGPIIPENNLGPEIDSFDFVIKFNHRKKYQGCDPLTQGKRVDASYYNGTQTDIVIEEQNGELPDELKVASFYEKSALKNVSGPLLLRPVHSLNSLLFNGNFNMLPNAVYDLLLHRPKIIKIFSNDLMLSRNRYESYRPSRIGGINYTRSCVTHDPLTQYSMLKHAWLTGLIIGDKEFERVMSLGKDDYMRELQSSWSKAVMWP